MRAYFSELSTRRSRGQRWFVGPAMVRGHDVHQESRKAAANAAPFFNCVLRQAETSGLLARAKPIDAEPPTRGAGCNSDVDFRGERGSNATHRPRPIPMHLARHGNGQAAILGYCAHMLLDTWHCLTRNVCATHATGTAEAEAAVLLGEATAHPGRTGALPIAGFPDLHSTPGRRGTWRSTSAILRPTRDVTPT